MIESLPTYLTVQLRWTQVSEGQLRFFMTEDPSISNVTQFEAGALFHSLILRAGQAL